MRAFKAILVLLLAAAAASAADIRKGATLQVKAGALFFEDAGKFARFQRQKKRDDAATLDRVRTSMLRAREAFAFDKPQSVKVLDIDVKGGGLRVEMLAEGRMQGTRWVVDEGAVE